MPLFESPLDPMLGPYAGSVWRSEPSSEELDAWSAYQLSWAATPTGDVSNIVTSLVQSWV
jgi:hypothetical protein